MTAGTERKQCLKPGRSFHFDHEKSRGIDFYKQKEIHQINCAQGIKNYRFYYEFIRDIILDPCYHYHNSLCVFMIKTYLQKKKKTYLHFIKRREEIERDPNKRRI